MSAIHTSVLVDEVIDRLAPSAGGFIIDATCGLGGHTEAILEASAPDGRVLAVDRDPAAIQLASERLARFGDRVRIVEGSFGDLCALAADDPRAEGVLADLGVSSLQLDDRARGFSFEGSADLDMRMGPIVGDTAYELLSSIDRDGLTTILRDGEVRNPRLMARAIIDRREAGELNTTQDLVKAAERGSRGPRRKIHPATLVFQAIRIAVNDELGQLAALLAALPKLLAEGGLAAIISFHSLEDRRVKQAFKDPPAPELPRNLPVDLRPRGPFELLSNKPITPSEEEIARNPRARSAKLRVARLNSARATEGSLS